MRECGLVVNDIQQEYTDVPGKGENNEDGE